MIYIKLVRGHVNIVNETHLKYKYSIRLINGIRYIVPYSPMNIETLFSSERLDINQRYSQVFKKYNNQVKIYEERK